MSLILQFFLINFKAKSLSIYIPFPHLHSLYPNNNNNNNTVKDIDRADIAFKNFIFILDKFKSSGLLFFFNFTLSQKFICFEILVPNKNKEKQKESCKQYDFLYDETK